RDPDREGRHGSSGEGADRGVRKTLRSDDKRPETGTPRLVQDQGNVRWIGEIKVSDENAAVGQRDPARRLVSDELVRDHTTRPVHSFGVFAIAAAPWRGVDIDLP